MAGGTIAEVPCAKGCGRTFTWAPAKGRHESGCDGKPSIYPDGKRPSNEPGAASPARKRKLLPNEGLCSSCAFFSMCAVRLRLEATLGNPEAVQEARDVMNTLHPGRVTTIRVQYGCSEWKPSGDSR